MTKKYEAILFDLGQVILRIHFEKVFESWAISIGKPLSFVKEHYLFDEGYAAHEVGEITLDEYHFHVCQMLKSDMPFEHFKLGWNSIFGDVISETAHLIKDLKKSYKLYIFSNSNVSHREIWSKQCAYLLKDFDRVFCSSQIRLRKPDAEAFGRICLETGISKKKFFFIDDLEANIAGAREFGIESYLFSEPASDVEKIRSILL